MNTRPIKTGMLTAHISREAAGVWEVVRNLSNALNGGYGVKASIWGLRAQDTDLVKAQLHLNGFHAFRTIGPRAIGYAPSLLAELSGANLDIVHAHGAWMYPSWVSYSWARKNEKPNIIAPHGMLDPWALKNRSWKKKIVSALFEDKHFRSASCIHALCEQEAKGLEALGLKKPVCIVSNGVNIPYKLRRRRPAWIETLAQGRHILLYLGRLDPKKGLEPLIRAVSGCDSVFRDNWVVLIAGQNRTAYGRTLRKLVYRLKLERSVHFIGARYEHEKTDLFSASDAFILPSLSEGLPVAPLEAWAHGLPCLLTPECHLPDGFKAQAAMEISSEPVNIARGLERLAHLTEGDRQSMGMNGRMLVKKNFSWEKSARQMQSVYDWVLYGGSPPECVRAA